MTYVSQKGQDQWVVEEVFHHKKNGFFIDLAASNGTDINNTLILEQMFDWQGICIEPNPIYFEELQKNRKSINLNDCVDEKEHLVEFRYDNMECGGIVDDDTDNNIANRGWLIRIAREKNMILTLKTKTLEQILIENNAPKVIDYLSLDVEGAETRVLRHFPFDRYTFLAMTIERPSAELNAILFANGYVFVKNDHYDSFYVHESLDSIDQIKKEPFVQVSKKYWRKTPSPLSAILNSRNGLVVPGA